MKNKTESEIIEVDARKFNKTLIRENNEKA